MKRNILFFIVIFLCVFHVPVTANKNITFGPHEDINKFICERLSKARHEVEVCVYIFEYKPLADYLIFLKKNKGINVNVIIDKRSCVFKMADSAQTYSVSVAEHLLANGISVKLYDDAEGILHQKYIIIDTSSVIFGSYNFMVKAQFCNSENIMEIQDTVIVEIFKRNFQQLSLKCKIWSVADLEKYRDKAAYKERVKKILKYSLPLLILLLLAFIGINYFRNRKKKNAG